MNNEQIDIGEQVVSLVRKAERAESPDGALKFSQAACNAANAMMALTNARIRLKELGQLRSYVEPLSSNANCSPSASPSV